MFVGVLTIATGAAAQKKQTSASQKKQVSSSSSSQKRSISSYSSSSEGKMQIGPKLGMTVSPMSYDPKPKEAEVSTKTGIAIGGEFNYWINRNMAIVPQLMYTQKGVHNDYSAALANAKEDVTATYIEIPVHFKYRISDNNFRPHVFAGPSLGIFSSSKSEMRIGNREGEGELDEQFTSTDFAIDFGVGGMFDLSPKMELAVNAQYQLGMTDVFVSSAKVNGQSRGFRLFATLLFDM
jgi:hypothetical protein